MTLLDHPFWFCLCLVSILAATGCTAARLPNFEPQPIEWYSEQQEKDGLMIAIKGFTDEKQLERYFGKNLVEDGILPVLVVAENRSPTTSFILLRDGVRLGRPAEKATGDDVGSTTAAKTVGLTGLVSILAVPVASLALIPTAATMISSAKEESYSFLTKQFLSHTLSPGDQVFGFVYFRLVDGQLPPPNAIVEVSAMQPAGGPPIEIALPLNVRKP